MIHVAEIDPIRVRQDSTAHLRTIPLLLSWKLEAELSASDLDIWQAVIIPTSYSTSYTTQDINQ